MIAKANRLSGLGEWVEATRAALSPAELDTHYLVMIGLHYALFSLAAGPKGANEMNWYDAEQIVLGHQADAWRMDADKRDAGYESAPSRATAWLGALLLRYGYYLQGREAALATWQTLHDGRVRSA